MPLKAVASKPMMRLSFKFLSKYARIVNARFSQYVMWVLVWVCGCVSAGGVASPDNLQAEQHWQIHKGIVAHDRQSVAGQKPCVGGKINESEEEFVSSSHHFAGVTLGHHRAISGKPKRLAHE